MAREPWTKRTGTKLSRSRRTVAISDGNFSDFSRNLRARVCVLTSRFQGNEKANSDKEVGEEEKGREGSIVRDPAMRE